MKGKKITIAGDDFLAIRSDKCDGCYFYQNARRPCPTDSGGFALCAYEFDEPVIFKLQKENNDE